MGASRTVLTGRRRTRGWRRAASGLAVAAGMVLTALAPVPASAAQAPAGCPAPATGELSCAALVSPGSTVLPASAVRPATAAAAASLPPGLSPLNLRNAYGLTSSALTGGVGQTVAVVTEYGDPTAEADLATYRSEYSLPPCGGGCFSAVDENGGTNYPPVGPAGWTAAAAESLDMISAICPNCHILLVQAGVTSNGATTVGITDTGAAENTAVRLGARFVTNTWFTPEASFGTSEPTYDSEYFDHPGVAITAPDGDGAGYGTYYPAASPDVIAVGGTTLTQATSAARGWTEAAWSGTGSGCSPYEAKPSWQTDTGCSTRMLNDTAAVADPASEVSIYDTATGGWFDGGGTDVASAVVAAAYALAGTPAAGTFPASYLYAHHGAGLVNDITSGNDGTCTVAYYCAAGTGYDGPTGLGTPASATALGATAPDATLAGGPAVADPENGSLDVFGVGNENGTVWGDSWTRSGGWSGWSNLSGTLSGIPLSAVYDAANGNLEVYGLGENGDVEEDYTSNGSTWSGWKNMGGTFAGSPSAVYDPLDNSVDVWEVGTAPNGTAFEDSWKPGSGWSGWQNKSGTFSGAGLGAVYDAANATMHVFGVGNANGTVWGGSYTPSGSFSGWSNMSGEMTGKLSPLYDPLNHNLEVYGQALSGYTEESFSSNNGSSWAKWGELASAGTSLAYPPTAVYNPLDNSIEVWAAGTGPGTTFDDSWTVSGGWAAWANRSGGIGSGLAPVFDPNAGDLRIFGVGQANGTVFGAALTPSGGWDAWGNMSGTLQTGDMS
jgi:hypothetical protein